MTGTSLAIHRGMRIQETDRILKESRYARHAAHQQPEDGIVSRAWKAVSTKLMGLFHRTNDER